MHRHYILGAVCNGDLSVYYVIIFLKILALFYHTCVHLVENTESVFEKKKNFMLKQKEFGYFENVLEVVGVILVILEFTYYFG